MSYEFQEKDWKLFRKKVPEWQEAYMDRLNHEYIDLLSREGNPSEKFWALDKRIRQDKKKAGVIITDMRRRTMTFNIIELIQCNAINMNDLKDFSPELQDHIRHFMGI